MEWNSRIETLYKCNYYRAEPFETEFNTCNLVTVKQREGLDISIVLICVVKNDLLRLKAFVNHYRKLGIKHFAFVDNNSTDGTFEFLLQQNDCDLYQCNQVYSSLRRVIWLNKLIGVYGKECWYIMVDSDELLMYPEMEKYSITNLIKYANNNGIYRISGYLLDMYSKKGMFTLDENADFIKEFRYFDGKGYDIHNTEYGVSIMGGPRRRAFRGIFELAKCPIFKLTDGDIVASAHFLLPRIRAAINPIWLAIAHYKFLDDKDEKKMNAAVKSEVYSSGSYAYKIYKKKIEDLGTMSLYDEGVSVELNSSSVLRNLPYINFPTGGIQANG